MIKAFIKERLGTIIILLIAAILVLWGVISINNAKKNAISYSTEYVAPEGNRNMEDAGKYVSVAKTEHLELFYNEATGAVQIQNLDSGYLWKGVADDEIIDLSSLNDQWKAYVQSPITITYNDLDKRDASPAKRYAFKDCGNIESSPIENGVSVTYGFLKAGIYVTVEYTLEDGEFVVRIPTDQIREDSTFALTTMEVLPFLGSTGTDTDGYLLYPDGSGAITTYAKASERTSNVKAANYYTFTNKTLNYMQLFNDSYDRYTAAMPIFGIKNDNDALLGVFTEGEEDSGVAVYPSGYVVNLNHIGFEVYIRNVFNVNMFNIASDSDTVVTGSIIQRVDKTIIPGEREIRYFCLSGEEANYSGMAQTYRDYLIDNNELGASISEEDTLPLSLELLMGITKEGMLFDEYVAMTTFDETQEILDELRSKGIDSTQVVLKSWVKGGEEREDYWPVASQLGGKSGLNDLNQYAEANPGSKLYLENQFTDVSSKTSGISETADVAYDGLKTEVSISTPSGMNYYLLNPQVAFERNANFISKLEDYSKLNVAYRWLGKYAYPDYNQNAPFTKSETVSKLKEILQTASNSGRNVAVEGANQYSYGEADYIYHLKEESYGLAITDYSVPFVELVLSGRVAYSTDGAGNLSSDLQQQKLRWLEYGATPYFYLTYKEALELRQSDYDELFSSTFADWEDTVVEVYQEFQDVMGDLYGQQMISHEVLSDNLVYVEYADGTGIYINYNNEAVTVNGVSVAAKDYTVVKGGKQ